MAHIYGKLPKEPDQTPADETNAEAEQLVQKIVTGLAIALLRVVGSLGIGFCGALAWSLLGRIIPSIEALGGERGPPIAGMVVTVAALAWFFRSLWTGPIVILVAVLSILLFLRFGTLTDPFRWLAVAGIAAGMGGLIWVHRSNWLRAAASFGSIALGLYFLGREVPFGPLGLLLCVGGVLALMVASSGVAVRRNQRELISRRP
jgi:hypothetical protein